MFVCSVRLHDFIRVQAVPCAVNSISMSRTLAIKSHKPNIMLGDLR
jgi:hypothetical protein